VAVSGALVGLSLQTVLLKLPGWLTVEKYSDSPVNLSVPPHPVRLPPRESCVGDQEWKILVIAG
jgi:hypothetical protein